MQQTGYLSVLSSDLYNDLKRYVHKRLIPLNLRATPTLLYKCENYIDSVRTGCEQLYVVHRTGAQFLNSPHCVDSHVRDIIYTSAGQSVAIDVSGDVIVDNKIVAIDCRSIEVKDQYLYMVCGIIGIRVWNLSLQRHEYSIDREVVQKALPYGEFMLLLVGYDSIELFHKTTSVKEIRFNRPVYDAVVDDEGRVLVLHPNCLTLLDSDLVYVCHVEIPLRPLQIHLHNHSLICAKKTKLFVIK